MADTVDLIRDKQTVVSLLAKRLEIKPKDLNFLFGSNPNDKVNVVIPDFRTMQD